MQNPVSLKIDDDKDLHKQMKQIAVERNLTLGECIKRALEAFIKEDKRQKELDKIRNSPFGALLEENWSKKEKEPIENTPLKITGF